ncbi:MAG: adenylate cyclase [Candidatus Cloacimonadota bacterium]|nr:adenylate cyclase [Candidatus Cloacimonadota bacterium]
MKFLRFIFLAILLVVLVILFSSTSFWQNMEYRARDLFFMFRGERATSEEIVLVEISDDTINSLGKKWPFPQKYHAKVIDNLFKAGAKQVIFEVTLSAKSTNKQDSLLVAASKHRNVVFAGKLLPNLTEKKGNKQVLKPTSAILQTTSQWGLANIPIDTDGFVRRYQLYEKIAGKNYYSLGVVARAGINGNENWRQNINDRSRYFELDNIFIPKATSQTAYINYFGPAGTFPYYDYADVIDDADFKLPVLDTNKYEQLKKDEVFKDKIVIVGVTAEELNDYFNTPFLTDNNKMTPGIEIHANFLEMVNQEKFLKELHFIKFVFVMFVLAVLLMLVNRILKPLPSLIVNLVLIAVSFFVIYNLFVQSNLIIPILPIPVLIVLIYIVCLVVHYFKVNREKAFIRAAFSKNMAPELVEELGKNPSKLELGGQQKEITVLFTNIRSFTSYAEKHNPKETTGILREYLNEITAIIKLNKGIVDKYVGDEVVSLFGIPLDLPDHAFWACKAALEIREKVLELQQKWQAKKLDIIEIGSGINSGFAIVGNLGSDTIFDYTAIGDTVSVGSRLEELNKVYETHNNIIISEATYEMVKDRIIAEFIEEVTVQGRNKPVAIYQLIGIKKELKKEEK